MKKELFYTPYQEPVIGYVLVLIRIAEKVIVIRKKRPAWQAGKLNYPGGKIESGESPVQAAVRELREETGIIVSEQALRPVGQMLRVGDFCIFVFAAAYAVAPVFHSLTDEEVSIINASELSSLECLDSLAWLHALAFSGGDKLARIEYE